MSPTYGQVLPAHELFEQVLGFKHRRDIHHVSNQKTYGAAIQVGFPNFCETPWYYKSGDFWNVLGYIQGFIISFEKNKHPYMFVQYVLYELNEFLEPIELISRVDVEIPKIDGERLLGFSKIETTWLERHDCLYEKVDLKMFSKTKIN